MVALLEVDGMAEVALQIAENSIMFNMSQSRVERRRKAGNYLLS